MSRHQLSLNRALRSPIMLILGFTLLALLVGPAQTADGKSKQKLPVVSPLAGKTYNVHSIRLVVRAHRHDEVAARLNGIPVADELAKPRGNRRVIRVSATHGLRHGHNVLHVRVNRFRGRTVSRTLRFRLAGRRPLASAGRSLTIAPGARLRLNGRRSRLHPRTDNKRLRYRWTIVKAPGIAALTRSGATRGSRTRRARQLTRLMRRLMRGPRSARPVFRPLRVGHYIIRLTVVGSDGRIGRDQVDLTVDPPPALRVNTMAQDSDGRWGVRVGSDFYPAKAGTWLQLVVLDRSLGTLRSNTSYDCPSPAWSEINKCMEEVKSDLAKLRKDALVIATNPGDGGGTKASPHGIPTALSKALKVPLTGQFPADDGLVRGTYSAIGAIGGPSVGNYAPANRPGSGAIRGLLIRNTRLNYTFTSPDRVSFDTQAPGSDERTNVIRVGETEYRAEFNQGSGGFHVVVINRQTLAGESHWFDTANKKGQPAYNVMRSMRDVLAKAIQSDRLVLLASRGTPHLDAKAYEGLTASHDLYGFIQSTADSIQKLGGTRSSFFKLIDSKLYAEAGFFPYRAYTLVGRSSGPGQGAESHGAKATGPNDLNPGPIGGTLARSTNAYSFDLGQTVNEEPTGDHNNHNPAERLIEVVYGQDTPWPEQGDKGRMAAIAWVGSQSGLTNNPRSQYYTRPYTDESWDKTQKLIEALKPEDLPEGVSGADVNWAKSQLSQEIDWLQAVHGYVSTLAAPYRETSLQSWANLQSIATAINKEIEAHPTDEALVILGELFNGAREAAGELPGIGEALGVANTVYEIALKVMEFFDGEDDPNSSFETTVAKVGVDLADRLREAEDTLNKRFTNVIAADFGKLRAVALCSLGVYQCPGNPADWQLTSDQQVQIGRGLMGSMRNTFYASLLPAKYTLWAIPKWEPARHAKHWYGLGAFGQGEFYPFVAIPDSGQFAMPHCRDLGDPENRDRWQVMALGIRSGAGTWTSPYTMQVPRASVTNPLFAKVDPQGYPEEGGMGNLAEAFYLRYFEPEKLDPYPHRDSLMSWNWPRRTDLGLCSGD